MNTTLRSTTAAAVAAAGTCLVRRPLAIAWVLLFAHAPLAAETFNYHGQLLDGAAPASGRYDLRLRSFAQPDAKVALGATVELPAVEVIDGSFAVELDLPDSKIGDTFVEVSVRKADSNEAFEVLGAPQMISKANNGCWALDGNTGVAAGSFVGVADPASGLPIELRARNQRVAVFYGNPDPTLGWGNAPIIALGSSGNVAVEYGSTVAGGGATRDGSGAVCVTCPNAAAALFATVGGGLGNKAIGVASVVSGGNGNRATGGGTSVSGGTVNFATGMSATVAGGEFNCAGGDASFAAGSRANTRTGNEGSDIACSGVASSGDANGDEGTFVWADAQLAGFTSTGSNQFLVRAAGGVGINTATMGAATNLRSGEIVVKNSTTDPNTDITLLTSTNRGFGLVSEPGTSGNAGRFYITEVDARAAGVLFNPRLRINVDGTTSVVGGAVTNISDARVKKNIAAIEQPLDTLLALRGHTFEYIDPAASMNPPGTRIGFVAQEVREVLPQWISDVGGGHLGVQTSGFEALAVEAIRDLKQQYDARVESLEHANATLLARLERLEAQQEP